MSLRSLPFTSLNAATTTGAGASKDLEGVSSTISVCLFVTGTPSTVTVVLEGSHDGVNWCTIPNPVITVSGYTSSYTVFANHLFRYVRTNLLTLTGGSAPTVTTTVAAL